jgi:uncharacterized protein YggE
MKLIKILALAAAAGALALVIDLERPGSAHSAAPDNPTGITVTGNGTGKAAPDTAHLSFGVSTDAATSAAAVSANAAKMDKVPALKRVGIPDSDIQTENVSVYPRHEDGNSRAGYTANNTVEVTVHGVKRAGPVIDAATAAGATEAGGPSLERENQDALYREALKDAVADARSKAQVLAGATGVSLGRVTRVEEAAQNYGYGVFAPMAREAATATPIQPGTQEIQASVTVTFAIS